jgi:hypothetical protein
MDNTWRKKAHKNSVGKSKRKRQFERATREDNIKMILDMM